MEEIRLLTNFANNKALRFEQTSPLAVPMYSVGTQFVQSALSCVHPKRAVACATALLSKEIIICFAVYFAS